ncbi:MAG TPA: hypothetical protein VHS78_14510 [Candidatus Elarobacter sp.]|jgi:ATP/maltotriose-dependent transcriptional regulator MalT|nr:hypothetical protein [Candidatus Elarobacter sp.]
MTASRFQTRADAAHPQARGLDRLAEAARKPLAVIAAPAGSGKSALLRAFAAREGAVLIDLAAGDGTFRGAVRMLCDALREIAPGARLAFASAYARAAERGDRATSLARWFARYVDDAGVTIAIDALDRLGAETRAFAEFVEALVRAARDAHVVIAARDDADLPVPRWFAGELIAMPLAADDARDAAGVATNAKTSPTGTAPDLTVDALLELGRVRDALELASRAGPIERVREVLRAHGLQLEDRGDVDVVEAALDLLPPDDDPVIMLLRAVREVRLGRSDTSEAWFRQALARAETQALKAEAAYRLGREIVRRERSDAVELLEPFANDDALDVALRCAISAVFAEALLVAGREAESVAAIGAALRYADRLDVPARAHLLTRASYVELYAGDRTRARECALAGAALAEQAQLYTVGAGSYSVLYNLAYEDAGPSESLVYLERLAECAVRTGNVDFHLYAIVAAYELHVERGDVAAIERLEHDLREFDLHYGAASALQGLLPSRALVAAWSGAFASAYDLLAPSGPQQQNYADREALRWAEIALYAAAANMRDVAAAGLRSFAESFARDERATPHAVRGAILASLAAHLAGVTPEWRCEHPASGRLGALSRAVEAVIARLRGEAGAQRLLDAFDDLRRHEFGGLAKLFAALPEAV